MGIEPTTLCLASIRSSQLSYTRIEFAYIKLIFSFCQFGLAHARREPDLCCKRRKNLMW